MNQDTSPGQPCPLNMGADSLDQLFTWLIEIQDRLIQEKPITPFQGSSEQSLADIDADTAYQISFNLRLLNEIRFRNCRLFLSAGMRDLSIKEFSGLSFLSFEQLDLFFRELCASSGSRYSYNWYRENASLIAGILADSGEDTLKINYKVFAATCMECALADKDLDLAEEIADYCAASPPFVENFLRVVCLVYYSRPGRLSEALKWADLAISHQCQSAFPFIVRIRCLLADGQFEEALGCLDKAERFCYSNGLKEEYALILNERSAFMDNAN